jgi:hypothetical protein
MVSFCHEIAVVDPRTFALVFLLSARDLRRSCRGVLAVSLTLSAVVGDAERGLLQPLVVRRIRRPTLLPFL